MEKNLKRVSQVILSGVLLVLLAGPASAADAEKNAANPAAPKAERHGDKQHGNKAHKSNFRREYHLAMRENRIQENDKQNVIRLQGELKDYQTKNRPQRNATPDDKKKYREGLRSKREALNQAMEQAVSRATPATNTSSATTTAPAAPAAAPAQK